jgi:hypothetical protein
MAVHGWNRLVLRLALLPVLAGSTALVLLTPLGGVSFLAGWVMLALAAWKALQAEAQNCDFVPSCRRPNRSKAFPYAAEDDPRFKRLLIRAVERMTASPISSASMMSTAAIRCRAKASGLRLCVNSS